MRRLLIFLCTAAFAAAGPAEEVRAADTARVMATIAGDTARLAPLLADALSYGHSNGRVQTKAEFLEAVRSNRVRYEAYDYEEIQVTPVATDLALMTGTARLRASAGGERVAFRLRFLSVWRREDGAWRLFAYQSARTPDEG
jgi:ketosteroid isomerase-like protein